MSKDNAVGLQDFAGFNVRPDNKLWIFSTKTRDELFSSPEKEETINKQLASRLSLDEHFCIGCDGNGFRDKARLAAWPVAPPPVFVPAPLPEPVPVFVPRAPVFIPRAQDLPVSPPVIASPPAPPDNDECATCEGDGLRPFGRTAGIPTMQKKP